MPADDVCRLDAVAMALNTNVHQHDIGVFALGERDRVFGVRRDTTNVEAQLSQRTFEAQRQNRLVFDDDHGVRFPG